MNQNLQYAINWVRTQPNGAAVYWSMLEHERAALFGLNMPTNHPTRANWWSGAYWAEIFFKELLPGENFYRLQSSVILWEKFLRMLEALQTK